VKIRIINIIEIILFISFTVAYILTKTNVVGLQTTTLLLSALLGFLYFPLGFYTLKSTDVGIGYSIGYGFFFAFPLLAVALSLMNMFISIAIILFLIVTYVMIVSLPAVVNYLFNKPEGLIIMYNKPFTIRYLALAIFMIYALVTYDFQH
jgi:hypothetical protein